MKQEEKWVEEYLTHRGFRDIVYEPDGNVPPDFLVNGKIANEVGVNPTFEPPGAK